LLRRAFKQAGIEFIDETGGAAALVAELFMSTEAACWLIDPLIGISERLLRNCLSVF
jgi:hypothetical protein